MPHGTVRATNQTPWILTTSQPNLHCSPVPLSTDPGDPQGSNNLVVLDRNMSEPSTKKLPGWLQESLYAMVLHPKADQKSRKSMGCNLHLLSFRENRKRLQPSLSKLWDSLN